MATNDRIYIDEEFVPLADLLVRRQIPGSERISGVFRDTRELAVFAAGLGYRKKRTRSLGNNGREIKLSAIHRIRLGGVDIVAATAVAVEGNVAILHPDRAGRRAEIFESYMNGGLGYLAGMVDDRHTALEMIASIVKSEHAPEESTEAAIDLISKRL